jgi:hypothetical protein
VKRVREEEMDLIRSQSRIEAEKIDEKYAGKETEVLRVDLLKSSLAACRPGEIMEQLVSINMDSLQIAVVSGREGLSSCVWGSYKQWAGAGAQEKAAFVVFYKELEFAADPETGDAEPPASSRAPRRSSPPSK